MCGGEGVLDGAVPMRRTGSHDGASLPDPQLDRGAESQVGGGEIADPTVEPLALEDLADEITTLYAQVHAATQRLLTLIAEFDRRRGWEPAGHRSCADWLAFHTGIKRGAAQEKVRTAHALATLPATSAAMSRGELSFAKARALTRVATPENEGALLEYARAGTTETLERLVRGWKRLSRLDEQALERERHRSRGLSVTPDWDGSYVVRGRLEPEVGALVMRALEAAGDALYREGSAEHRSLADALGLAEPEALRATPKQRRADAIGLLAERALAAGFGVEASGSRAERYQVVIHVDAETLEADGEAGRSELEDGTRLSAETARRLACDASTVRLSWGPRSGGSAAPASEGRAASPGMTDGPPTDRAGAEGPDPRRAGTPRAFRVSRRAREEGIRDVGTLVPGGRSILDIGRKTRTIPSAIRRALDARDRGCRFPGCGLRFTDAHHVRHWADGGPTRLGNLLLLCRRHHRAVHEEGFRVEMGPAGRPNFYDRRGLPLPDVPPPAYAGERPVEALIRRNRTRGLDTNGWPSTPRFKREVDIPWHIEAAAREALEDSVVD